MHAPTLLMIVGPTAVGKTAISIRLAQHFHTEIVSVDARQFYQQVDIGTAKPTEAERQAVRHHLIDFLPVTQAYDVKQFEQDALAIVADIHRLHPFAIATGGSGLYAKTLVQGIDDIPDIPASIRSALQKRWLEEGLTPLLEELKTVDPNYFDVVDPHNHRRVLRALEVQQATGRPFSSFRHRSASVDRPFKVITVGLERSRDILYDRINQRVDQMVESGLVEEALALYPLRNHQALRTVGYQELFPMFEGQYDLAEAIRLIKRNTRRYAKRQLTWFRKDESIQWFDTDPDAERVVQEIISFVKQRS